MERLWRAGFGPEGQGQPVGGGQNGTCPGEQNRSLPPPASPPAPPGPPSTPLFWAGLSMLKWPFHTTVSSTGRLLISIPS